MGPSRRPYKWFGISITPIGVAGNDNVTSKYRAVSELYWWKKGD